ncbi:DOMON-like domain-containing protein [Accumulibacter sp.]|uniref:DOMON-like domain-containing protein n=1 Tax=Accumulibacter sp. TaxID=2053492 RepID=UPI001A51CE96|nr:DOMON-like domain-containing protein [Accumulibacter sp.]MBL8373299.1 DOMON-like domain-containing protein [Accumulibacter sp.]
MFPTEFALNLLRHPATPAPVVRSIEVHAARTVGGGLEFAYCLRGDMARLLIPAPQKAGCADGLWEHSCFEAFVGVLGEPAYHEFNFSPSGQWAAYAFSGYRQRDEALRLLVPPQITARLSVGRLELAAEIPATVLPPMAGVAPLQVGLAAVVEAIDTVDGSHSYWALRHPAALPDFHHRASFALELAPPREPA